MQGHKNSPCFACGRVLDLQKHAKRKFYENMAKTKLFEASICRYLVADTYILFFLFVFPLKKSLGFVFKEILIFQS